MSKLQKIEQLLSKSKVPDSPMAGPQEFKEWLEWMGMRRSKKNVEPWVDDIRYDLNRYGYRCDEFDDPKGIRLFTVGCSYSFGTAIPYETTFSYLVAHGIEKELGVPVTNWNLSSPGKSADYIARIVSSAVLQLKPDLSIINFSFIARREFIAENNRIIGFTPNVSEKIIRDVMYPEAHDVYHGFNQLASLPNDIRNFTLNYRLCEAVLERCGLIWCYSSLEESASERLIEIEGERNHIGAYLKSDRGAGDGRHPGPVPNRQFADSILEHLFKSGKIDKLRQIAGTRS